MYYLLVGSLLLSSFTYAKSCDDYAGLRAPCLGYGHGDIYPAEDDECKGFWTCDGATAILRCCGPGTAYDPILQVCVLEGSVECPRGELIDAKSGNV